MTWKGLKYNNRTLRSTIHVRFLKYVDKSGPTHPVLKSKCWIWLGSCCGPNYAYGYLDNCRAHRLSWLFHHGKIPKGIHVLHKCDNTKCVNPNHLYLGTQKDNLDDMTNKGRRAYGDKVANKGEANPRAILTEKEVLKIRAMKGKLPTVKIALLYGVEVTAIKRIISKKSWKHI